MILTPWTLSQPSPAQPSASRHIFPSLLTPLLFRNWNTPYPIKLLQFQPCCPKQHPAFTFQPSSQSRTASSLLTLSTDAYPSELIPPTNISYMPRLGSPRKMFLGSGISFQHPEGLITVIIPQFLPRILPQLEFQPLKLILAPMVDLLSHFQHQSLVLKPRPSLQFSFNSLDSAFCCLSGNRHLTGHPPNFLPRDHWEYMIELCVYSLF